MIQIASPSNKFLWETLLHNQQCLLCLFQLPCTSQNISANHVEARHINFDETPIPFQHPPGSYCSIHIIKERKAFLEQLCICCIKERVYLGKKHGNVASERIP